MPPRRVMCCLTLALLAGCRPDPPGPPAVARDLPGLHNVLRVNDKLLSGSGPAGPAAFRSLRELGVKTIISVDGMKPDVDLARREGLRYVHLPIGYDGVPREQALRIARAVRDLPGPVYLHCHHGKHRGPAAAAAAALCLDATLTPEQAVAFLRRAGTDPHYTGLYDTVAKLRRPTAGELEGVPAEFPEVARVSALAEAMVAIDQRWDNLKAARAAGWTAPPTHADLDPPHEALQLREQYREALRLPDVERRPAQLRQWLADAEAAAAELEAALRAKDGAAAERHFGRVQKSCQTCHDRYRDWPSGR